MEKYIGLDVHTPSTTFGVVGPSGKKLGLHVVETNGQLLVDQLKAIPGKRYVCMEEGTQSAWLYEILSPHAERVIVTTITESRGPKNDAIDAFGLAEKLRTGAIKTSVFKDGGKFLRLRELARVHSMLVGDAVRVQCRIKALYRGRGISMTGKAVYSENGRKACIEALPEAIRASATRLYAEFDAIVELRDEAEKDLVAEAHKHAISRTLETCPGLGPIRVARLLPIVVTPGRFRTRQQFWAYCGLGVVMRSSSDWVQQTDRTWKRSQVQHTRGLNLNHNHVLKDIFKGAATTVVQKLVETAPLRRDYERMLATGTKPNLAKLTLARKIASITLAMWKSQKEYVSTEDRKQTS